MAQHVFFNYFEKSVVSDKRTVASDRFHSEYHDINSIHDPESYMSSEYDKIPARNPSIECGILQIALEIPSTQRPDKFSTR